MYKYTICEFIYENGKLVNTNPPKKTGRYQVLRCYKDQGKTIVYADYAYYDKDNNEWYLEGFNTVDNIIGWKQEDIISIDLSTIHFDDKKPYIAKEPKYNNFAKGHSRLSITNELSAKYKANHYKKTNCVLATLEYQDEHLHDMLIIAIAAIEKSKVINFYLEKKDMTTKKVVGHKDFEEALSNLNKALVKYSKE